MKLTAKTTAAAKLPPGKDDHFHWDDDLPGFGLRLRAGSDGKVLRSWVCQYRRAGGSRRLRLGAAEVLSIEQARAMAKTVLAKVALGEDPQAEKAARRRQDGHTLKAVASMFLEARQSIVRPNTFRELDRYLTGSHFKPLHAMPIDQVTRRDVAVRLTKITAENGSVTARRARSALSSLYAWAVREGLAEANPVVGTNTPENSTPRERVLSDAELVRIWQACGDDDFGRVVRLCVLLGARRSEIGGMAWSELKDLEGPQPYWELPAARSKNRKAHRLPLLPMVLAIIMATPRMVTRDQLFGLHAAEGFSAWGKAKRALDARLGDKVAEWTLHDLRRTAATRMADIGIAPHVIEAVLNHISGHKGGVAGIYNRSSYDREKKAALALWSDHVRALVEGGEKKIVPLRA